MRVAIIKNNYTPYGGAEKYTTRMINAFVERDARVEVLTSASGSWEGSHHDAVCVPMRQISCNNLLKLLTFNASVKRHLEKVTYDCVLGMDRTEQQTHLRAGGGSHAAWLRRRCEENSRLRCLSFRVNPFHRAMLGIERKAFLQGGLKRIFCNSSLVKEEIRRDYPQTEGRIVVVHNGVEWHELARPFAEAAVARPTIARGLGLDPDRFHFLFVGSGYERKGLGKAIAALTRLPPDTYLLVVGKDKSEKRYRQASSRLGFAARVHFYGPRRDVLPFFQVADAFVLPTIYDPFSNAALEALAMGLYTVTSTANGCSEVIQDGAGSIIEDNRESASVAKAMQAALGSHLPRTQIRESVEHLDFEVQLKKIVDLCLSDAGR